MSDADRSFTAQLSDYLKLFPDATIDKISQQFPDRDKQVIRAMRNRIIKRLKLEELRLRREAEKASGEEKVEILDNMPAIPPKFKPGKSKTYPDGFEEDDLPEPTKKIYKGEKWRVTQEGKLEWYMPPNPDISHFGWYNTFLNNHYNFWNPKPLGRCHREWGEKLDSGFQRQMFKCPRNHHKSSYITIGTIVREICEYPRIPWWTGVLNVAWDKGLADANMQSITSNLTHNPLILDFYGYLIDEDRPNKADKKYFKFQPKSAKDPGLMTLGFRYGQITGSHPHRIVCDDIQLKKFSKKLMAKFRNTVNHAFLPALGEYGSLVITGTHKGYTSKDDAYLWLEQKPNFRVYTYPAIVSGGVPPLKDISYKIVTVQRKFEGKLLYNPDGSPLLVEKFKVKVKNRNKYRVLYPERYNIEWIMSKFLELLNEGKSAEVFYSEYMLDPSPPEGRYFKKNRIKSMEHMPFKNFHDYQSLLRYLDKMRIRPVIWIDPGGKGEAGHGNTIVVYLKLRGYHFILDILNIKSGILDTAKALAGLILKYNVKVWGCEGNWLQKQTFAHYIDKHLKEELLKKNKMEFYNHPKNVNNKGDKVSRVGRGIKVMLGEDGMPHTFYINVNTPGIDQFNEEIRYFGPNMTKEQKRALDALDAITSAETHLAGLSSTPVFASR